MPVRIYGTGGTGKTDYVLKTANGDTTPAQGKKTTVNGERKMNITVPAGLGDAVTSKVLKGTTFTSNNGILQTGTLKEKTYADFVSDSDTLPSSVESGKIFYNNSGKQVGTGAMLKTIFAQFKRGTELQAAAFNTNYICTAYATEEFYSNTVPTWGIMMGGTNFLVRPDNQNNFYVKKALGISCSIKATDLLKIILTANGKACDIYLSAQFTKNRSISNCDYITGVDENVFIEEAGAAALYLEASDGYIKKVLIIPWGGADDEETRTLNIPIGIELIYK